MGTQIGYIEIGRWNELLVFLVVAESNELGRRLSNLRLRLILAICSAAAAVADDTVCLRFDADGDCSKVRRTSLARSSSCCNMVSREDGGVSVVVGASVAVDAAALSFMMTLFIIHSAISIEDREDMR